MANAIKHKTLTPPYDDPQWKEEHVFAGGSTGSLLTWDATQTDKVAWKQALGLNEATPATPGMIAATLGANGVTGLRIKRFTDTGPAGKFLDLQDTTGGSLFDIDAALGIPRHGRAYYGSAFVSSAGFKHMLAGTSYFDGTSYITKHSGSNAVGAVAVDGTGVAVFAQPSSGASDRTDSPATWATYLRLRLTNAGRLGLGIDVPTATLHLVESAGGGAGGVTMARLQSLYSATVGSGASLDWTDSAGTVTGQIRVFTESAGNIGLYLGTYNGGFSTKVKIHPAGGVEVGAPTGGDKGAGTVNAVAVYDDNVLLTDYIWDLYHDGAVRPADRRRWGGARLWSIAETREFIAARRHLPTMPGRAEWTQRGARSVGAMVTALWETVEQLQIHVFDLDARLKART